MRVYEAQTAPLLDYYRARDLLIEVPGMGTVEEVSKAVMTALERA